jgi:hypothetical protein
MYYVGSYENCVTYNKFKQTSVTYRQKIGQHVIYLSYENVIIININN